jgi:hypothetical protein
VPSFDAVQSAEAFLLTLPQISTVFGVGIGGQAAIRLGFRHPNQFPIVVGRNSLFDFHDLHGHGTSLDDLYERKEQARQDTAILQIVPHSVPRCIWFACSPDSDCYRGNDRLHEKLAALSVPHTFEGDREATWERLFRVVAESATTTGRRLYG